MVEETTTLGSQTETVHYLWGLGLIAQTRAGQGSYYHADGLGSVKALSDAQGQTTDVYAYDAFGAGVDLIGSSGQPYRFAGEYYDADAQMQYHRARWYDAKVGRFSSLDSFSGNRSIPSSLNKYVYASSDPVNHTDPTGRFSLAAAGAALSISISLVSASFDVLNAYQSIKAGADLGAVTLELAANLVIDAVGVFSGAGLLRYAPQIVKARLGATVATRAKDSLWNIPE